MLSASLSILNSRTLLLNCGKLSRLRLMFLYREYFQNWVEAWRDAIQQHMDPRNLPLKVPPTSRLVPDQATDSEQHLRHHSSSRRFKARQLPRRRAARRSTWTDEIDDGAMESATWDYLRWLNAKFAPHPGSEVCRVCDAAEVLRQNGPDAIPRFILWRVFDRNMSGVEMAMIRENHLSIPKNNNRNHIKDVYEAVKFIRKVEIVLELTGDGQWLALRLQGYERGTSLKGEPQDVLRQLSDSELEVYFDPRLDSCVFLPYRRCSGGGRPVGSFLDPNLIKSWIQQCKTKHTICAQQREARFPVELILIDTKDRRIVDVVPGTEPSYLALSYTWGGVSQPELTKATRKRRSLKGGLSCLSLPNTILDAIHLAKLIGYRYLWVDALCIVQDDSSIRHHQIAQMYNIYQCADVTIVAAGGSDCSQAIPGVSLDRKAFQRYKLHNIPGLPLMKLPESTVYSITDSHWKARGWTFQEELCSQRLLVLLPECAVFTCPSAICREDLVSEVSPSSPDLQDSQDFREGLSLLSATIRSLQNSSPEQQVALFRDLVKGYMHRSLSRNDDIENAFAGVNRMLEPVLGPSYHGIPERHFAEIIHGCWFCDTTLARRRVGFPSWSWVGWVYVPKQVYMGINAIPGEINVLQFYRLGESIQKLGHTSTRLEDLSSDHPSKFHHFVPDEEAIRAKFDALQQSSNARTNRLIAFTTSCATLSLRPFHQYDFTSPVIREDLVIHRSTGKHLTNIRLDSEFVMQQGKVYLFIVIAYEESSDSFRLMLICPTRENRQIVERVNVTVQKSSLVRVDDWMSLGPERSTFIMA